MRLIFAGTPVFAERALAALIEAGQEIVLVLTRADRPAGRGQQLQASPVKQLALARGLPVFQPRSLRDAEARERIAAAGADAMVVAAYGLILPPDVLDAPRLGCINIHASLLPRWRGAAPIQRAIEAGDRETGITIMQMDEGLDTGPMLLARAIPIGPGETGGGLHDRLAELGADLIVEALGALERGALPSVPQPAEGATYAAKIEKTETEIDWRRPAASLADRVRAFDPFPGTLARLEGAGGSLKLWSAQAVGRSVEAAPGTVIGAGDGELVVACGDGALSLLELQKPGGRRLPVRDFLRGFPIAPGARFGVPTT
ncbi:methionyl-tRNA formyltransferase [Quisquiliibacterium transsilvanicum]|uniref:Methionyl-tRNA formyltransferase n=1 Tax=Quisquiliibacterium transsilvanicum TaxID=1549638 RepID=A0A7W8HKF6_9BURK|nr:methionyl-tRNA formyltransferase [Quisquiliibacterium transsilvanicum]MBB5272828.1 methionyl-tRNA formyltransferase [Quisquiliibacterium transsilvanicum]